MGRWKQGVQCKNDVYDGVVFVFRAVTAAQAKRVVSEHNADCDRYEVRIAELEVAVTDARQEKDNLLFQRNDFRHWYGNEQKKAADLTVELARVKAESLRVVPCGEPCRLEYVDADHVEYHGQIYESSEKDYMRWYCISDFEDCITASELLVQPVRLELWEAEE